MSRFNAAHLQAAFRVPTDAEMDRGDSPAQPQLVLVFFRASRHLVTCNGVSA